MRKVGSVIKMMAIALLATGLSVMAFMRPVEAKIECDNPAGCAGDGVGSISEGQEGDLMGTVKTIINVIIYVVGLIAVVMIIMGGIQYTTSQGDAGKVKKAKDTILYGIIGLVVAILAFAVVNFVLSSVFTTTVDV